MEFKDHFSDRAVMYSRYRPTYPDELFAWIASLVSRREVVWDCATGSGQAAVGLAKHFDRVIATDASEKQISMADPHDSIDYRVANAYESGLENESVDAVTIAQAIHWLDPDRFYGEAMRVMRPDAAIVVWCYGDPVIDDHDLNLIVHQFNRGTVERYWKPERKVILSGLRTIAFPFAEIPAPSFTLEKSWTLEELTGYLRTWSATAAFVEENGVDPVGEVEDTLARSWGERHHLVRWPIYIRAGFRHR